MTQRHASASARAQVDQRHFADDDMDSNSDNDTNTHNHGSDASTLTASQPVTTRIQPRAEFLQKKEAMHKLASERNQRVVCVLPPIIACLVGTSIPVWIGIARANDDSSDNIYIQIGVSVLTCLCCILTSLITCLVNKKTEKAGIASDSSTSFL